jgi:hypothetical protein
MSGDMCSANVPCDPLEIQFAVKNWILHRSAVQRTDPSLIEPIFLCDSNPRAAHARGIPILASRKGWAPSPRRSQNQLFSQTLFCLRRKCSFCEGHEMGPIERASSPDGSSRARAADRFKALGENRTAVEPKACGEYFVHPVHEDAIWYSELKRKGSQGPWRMRMEPDMSIHLLKILSSSFCN